MTCAFRPRKHFKEMQIERGVSEKEVRNAINKGSKFKGSDGNIHAVYGKWKIIYKERPCNFILITVYLRQGD